MADGSRYQRYTPEQVEALEKLYNDCPKPSSHRRQQLAQENPILSNIDPKSIKVWFQNRRCREKQRKEASRLLSVNAKLTALNKLLMEENERLTKHSSQLAMENSLLRRKLQATGQSMDIKPATFLGPDRLKDALPHSDRWSPKDERPLLSGLPSPLGDEGSVPECSTDSGLSRGSLPPLSVRHASPQMEGLVNVAEQMLNEFLAKATGTAVDWVQMPGLKVGPDSVGIVSVGHGCKGMAARACGLVPTVPTRVMELIKGKASWLRDCRRCDSLGGFRTASGGTVELRYLQLYSPTTLAPPRDLCTLQFSTVLEDGSLVACERSLTSTHGVTAMPPVPSFVRAEMLTSGVLVRSCEGGGCVVVIVDHIDLEAWAVPDVLRPLYSSPGLLASSFTLPVLKSLKRVAMEEGSDGSCDGRQQPAAWRGIADRIARGFYDAVNAFSEDGWVPVAGDGMDDLSVAARPAQKACDAGPDAASPGLGGGVVCARASMLLQVVPPSKLVHFLRENRSKWSDLDADATGPSTSTSIGSEGPAGLNVGYGTVLPGGASSRGAGAGTPLAVAMDSDEFVELVRLAQPGSGPLSPGQSFLLQLCTCPAEAAVGPAQLIFAPVDASASADAVPLLPSGFRFLPVDSTEADIGELRAVAKLNPHLDLTTLEGKDPASLGCCLRSVLTIAFQFVYNSPSHQEIVAASARRYVRRVVASVQRIAMALAPSCLGPPSMPPPSTASPSHAPPAMPSGPEVPLLVQRVLASYRHNFGTDLLKVEGASAEATLSAFWELHDAILCVKWKPMPEFVFANGAGLEMLEAPLKDLPALAWDRTLNEEGRDASYSALSQTIQQGYSYLGPGQRVSSTGRTIRYDRAFAWKVLDRGDQMECIVLLFQGWSFVDEQRPSHSDQTLRLRELQANLGPSL